MNTPLRRYEFSERLAEILGESRRDLRFRVTLLITGGLIPPGPRGPGSPLATPGYAADFLIGVLAAPQQVHTVDAVRCYRALIPATTLSRDATPGIAVGTPRPRPDTAHAAEPPFLVGRPGFGDALAQLLELARDDEIRPSLAEALFGISVARGFPAAALQLASWAGGRRVLFTQRYGPAAGTLPPAWLDPDRGGTPDPGLFHSIFLPAGKLIAIGMLTAPDKERTSSMIDLGNTLNNLAELARQRRHQRPWQSFLGAARNAIEVTERIDSEPSHLIEVIDFGSNPGELRMLTYVPNDLPANAPLVVVLHGCTQTAHSYDDGTGWTTLADRYGFVVLLPEQRRRNNPLRCFNWFRDPDNTRDSGETLSIRQMVAKLQALHGTDPARVFVTGLSAGAAMTSAMLATYPEVFAGGAIVAGTPYRAASGLQDAFEVIFQGRSLPADAWAERVRSASDHAGPWPTVSVWHGDADSTVKPLNAEEIVKQWGAVHGLASDPSHEESIAGHRRRVWRDGDGRDVIEAFTISGMSHGQPIDPQGEDGCGRPAPFIHNMGISSAEHIARFWGIAGVRRPNAVRRRPTRPVKDITPEIIPIRTTDRPLAGTDFIVVDSHGDAHRDRSTGDRSTGDRSSGGERFRQRRERTARTAAGAEMPGVGVDVHGIISKSFELAGLLKRRRDGTMETTSTGAPLGIDIPQIISTSLEAAGLFRSDRRQSDAPPPPRTTAKPAAEPTAKAEAKPAAEPADAPTPTPEPAAPADRAKTAKAATPTATPTGEDGGENLTRSFEAAGLLRTVRDVAPPPAPAAKDEATAAWDSSGWTLLAADAAAADAGAPNGGPLLFGHASSGLDGETGPVVRAVSMQVTLGEQPRLSYRRRLELNAAVNMATTAAFTVRVDGVAVDEASAVGMDYREAEWTERREIDLGRVADRTVVLTFELTADANVAAEVAAKAWIRGITLHEAAHAAALSDA